MTQNPFGLHAMDAFVDEVALWAYLHAARPASVVVLNNPARAQAIKARFPAMLVVHRQYHHDDPRWFELMTPRAWVDDNARFGANGVIAACLNEPVGDFRNDADFRRRFVDWCVGVVDAARGVMNVALPNWSTGNPHESAIISGGFDDLIRAIATAPHAWFSAHEYWHDDPVAEAPYTIGRNVFWSDRAALLGLPRLKMVLTEYGLDTGGGGGDGWRNQGISDEAYADQLKRSRSVQPNKPPVAIYCFGDGFGWGSFNVAGSRVLDLLKDYQEPTMTTIVSPPPEWDVDVFVMTVPVTGLNLRSSVNTGADNVIRAMAAGESVKAWRVPLTPSTDGKYLMAYVQDAKGNRGYAATHDASGAAFFAPPVEPVVILPEPPTDGAVTYSAEENDALRTALVHALSLVKETPPGGNF